MIDLGMNKDKKVEKEVERKDSDHEEEKEGVEEEDGIASQN